MTDGSDMTSILPICCLSCRLFVVVFDGEKVGVIHVFVVCGRHTRRQTNTS